MRGFFERRAVLGCEHLEGRDCPAIIVFGGFMAVIGTSGADTVEITDDGAGNVSATLNGTTREASGIQAVTVLTFGGDDVISYELTGDVSGYHAVAVDAGGGADEISATVAGEIDGYLAVALAGGSGADTITGEIDVAADSTGTVVAAVSGGFGNDDLTLNVEGDGVETLDRLLAVLSGGPGTDTGEATDNVRKLSIEA